MPRARGFLQVSSPFNFSFLLNHIKLPQTIENETKNRSVFENMGQLQAPGIDFDGTEN